MKSARVADSGLSFGERKEAYAQFRPAYGTPVFEAGRTDEAALNAAIQPSPLDRASRYLKGLKNMAAILVMAVMSVPAAAQESWRVTYNAVWGALIIFTIDVEVQINDGRYKASMDGRTRGLMRLFEKGETHVVTEGLLGADGTATVQTYEANGRWSGEDFSRTMTYGPDGQLTSMELDWPEEWLEEFKHEEVPVELRRSPDPFAAIVQFFASDLFFSARTAPHQFQTFDGQVVMKVDLQCGEQLETVKKNRFSDYFGEVRPCRMEQEMVAGHLILTEEQKEKRAKRAEKAKKKAEKRQRNGEEPIPEGLTLYVQEVEGLARPLMIRAISRTNWGEISVYLQDYSVSNLAAMATSP